MVNRQCGSNPVLGLRKVGRTPRQNRIVQLMLEPRLPLMNNASHAVRTRLFRVVEGKITTPGTIGGKRERDEMRGLLMRTERSTFLLGAVSFSLFLMAGCGGGISSTGSTPPPVTGAVTPTVTVTASPAGSVSTAQALSVAIAVSSSSGTPPGSVVVSSGNYASFPANVSADRR